MCPIRLTVDRRHLLSFLFAITIRYCFTICYFALPIFLYHIFFAYVNNIFISDSSTVVLNLQLDCNENNKKAK